EPEIVFPAAVLDLLYLDRARVVRGGTFTGRKQEDSEAGQAEEPAGNLGERTHGTSSWLRHQGENAAGTTTLGRACFVNKFKDACPQAASAATGWGSWVVWVDTDACTGEGGSAGSSLLPMMVKLRPSCTCTGVPSISRTVFPLRYHPREPV